MEYDMCFNKDMDSKLWEHCGESNRLILLGRIGDNFTEGGSYVLWQQR